MSLHRASRLFLILQTASALFGATYEIGPGRTYATIGAAPWSSLQPGDTVNIYPRTPVELTTAADSAGTTLTFESSTAAVAIGSSVYFPGGPSTLPSVIAVSGNTVILDPGVTIGSGVGVKFFPPYFEKLMITNKGTQAQPLIVQGVADPETGALPILDATGATTASTMPHYGEPQYFDDLGLVLLTPTTARNDYPKWVTLKTLRLQHARRGTHYSDITGAQRTLGTCAAGVRLSQSDHVTLDGLEIYENDNGLFGKTSGTENYAQFSNNLTIRRSHFWGNGAGGQCHQSYIEANGAIYEFNFYDLSKAGTSVNQIKDRSAGTVIRYNYILQAGHHLDLVESQDSQTVFPPLPSYRETFVYGNIFHMKTPPPSEESFIHYGYDAIREMDRAGWLYVYHNTFVVERDYNEAYRIVITKFETAADKLDFRNNIVLNKPVTPGQTNPLMAWTYNGGVAQFGVNWVSPHWAVCRDGVGACTTAAAGTENFYTPASVWDAPNFRDLAGRDFGLVSGSTAIGRAGSLAPPVTANSLGMDLTPVYQYVAPMSYTARSGLRDLGATESDRGALLLTISTPGLSNGKIDVPYTQPLSATGGLAPYLWSVSDGALCAGLSLAAGGIISGTPAATEVCAFTVQVVDAAGASASMPLSIRVSPPTGTTRRVGQRSVLVH
jgi:hypothetical protein